jgi:ACT domain-containing protein
MQSTITRFFPSNKNDETTKKRKINNIINSDLHIPKTYNTCLKLRLFFSTFLNSKIEIYEEHDSYLSITIPNLSFSRETSLETIDNIFEKIFEKNICLTEFRLEINYLENMKQEDIFFIFKSLNKWGIKHLDISKNPFFTEKDNIFIKGLETFLNGSNNHIISLNLSNISPMPSSIDTVNNIIRIIDANKSIMNVKLGNNYFGDKGFNLISGYFKINTNIRVLSLNNLFTNLDKIANLRITNNIKDILLNNKTIESLDLSNNIILYSENEVFNNIKDGIIGNNTIKKLNLSSFFQSHNKENMDNLYNMIKENKSLTSIDLSDNELELDDISNIISLNNIEILNFNKNKIDLECYEKIDVLIKYLQCNNIIREIHLYIREIYDIFTDTYFLEKILLFLIENKSINSITIPNNFSRQNTRILNLLLNVFKKNSTLIKIKNLNFFWDEMFDNNYSLTHVNMNLSLATYTNYDEKNFYLNEDSFTNIRNLMRNRIITRKKRNNLLYLYSILSKL